MQSVRMWFEAPGSESYIYLLCRFYAFQTV